MHPSFSRLVVSVLLATSVSAFQVSNGISTLQVGAVLAFAVPALSAPMVLDDTHHSGNKTAAATDAACATARSISERDPHHSNTNLSLSLKLLVTSTAAADACAEKHDVELEDREAHHSGKYTTAAGDVTCGKREAHHSGEKTAAVANTACAKKRDVELEHREKHHSGKKTAAAAAFATKKREAHHSGKKTALLTPAPASVDTACADNRDLTEEGQEDADDFENALEADYMKRDLTEVEVRDDDDIYPRHHREKNFKSGKGQ
ncbi:hypothetical protein BJ878DRAFT_550325 [Calycina marina]|uniref:Uncharacterized protein n=1 Tax=Calycina marina TaxID=1763456 RepID=A0A9P8CF56_9HELO|nr:hypothetical protein BJ878DRAFT_550325 [Calycina marina]